MKTQGETFKEHEKSRDFFCTVSDAFRIFARRSSRVLGSAWAFSIAILIIVVWGITGPAFHYSDTWQLIINTGTTIVTFLMVFLIQNTQNRDAKAVHLKLDEIIRAVKGARNELVDLENLSDEELTRLEKQFKTVRARAQRNGDKLEHRESKPSQVNTNRCERPVRSSSYRGKKIWQREKGQKPAGAN
jgi:low affinity Fe/Cu permease